MLRPLTAILALIAILITISGITPASDPLRPKRLPKPPLTIRDPSESLNDTRSLEVVDLNPLREPTLPGHERNRNTANERRHPRRSTCKCTHKPGTLEADDDWPVPLRFPTAPRHCFLVGRLLRAFDLTSLVFLRRQLHLLSRDPGVDVGSPESPIAAKPETREFSTI
jgi:hypothetical protein